MPLAFHLDAQQIFPRRASSRTGNEQSTVAYIEAESLRQGEALDQNRKKIKPAHQESMRRLTKRGVLRKKNT
jgi:hypothetical protein